MQRQNKNGMECIICRKNNLEILDYPETKFFTTGADGIFENNQKNIRRAICKSCGTIQFSPTKDYLDTMEKVFLHFLHRKQKFFGTQTKVFSGGEPALSKLCDRLKQMDLPRKGVLLDIGCGDGEFLTEFHKRFSDWSLYGMDVGDSFKDKVESRPGVKAYFDSITDIYSRDISFDLVTLNLVLSCADNADEILRFIYSSLNEKGLFFVWEKDCAKLPFMAYCLAVRMMFHRQYIKKLLSSFGFTIIRDILNDTENSCGFILKKESNFLPLDMYNENKKIYEKIATYLKTVIDIVSTRIQNNKNIGVFGTSNAGLWMMTLIHGLCKNKEKNLFFLDEDVDVAGNDMYGWHVYLPEDFKKEGIVFMPFPYQLAKKIESRMKENRNLINCDFISFKDLDMEN